MARKLISGMEIFPAAKQPFHSLTFCADANEAEVVMPKGRQKSPGSFQDELGGVIDRVASARPKLRADPDRSEKKQVSNTAELNDRLFENAWRKGR